MEIIVEYKYCHFAVVSKVKIVNHTTYDLATQTNQT